MTTEPAVPGQVFRVSCSSCGKQPPGPGGILCPACATAIASRPPYPDDDGSER